jgi:hypothetical protein
MRIVPPKRPQMRGMPTPKMSAFAFGGGLDIVTPAMAIDAGKVIDAQNYEPDLAGGYRRIYGYERYDGRPSPSAQSYWVIACTITDTISVGNTITGLTSGATAVVLQVNGSTELIVTKYTGTFVLNESLRVSGVTKATFTTITQNGGSTPALHATYKNLAAANYRTDIQAVPGSGTVRGVWYYKGSVYAFRNNAGGTQCVMHKATSSGWTAIAFGYEIQFTGAVGEIFDGDTVSCGGYTGVVRRALLRTGTWTVGGAGTLVFDSISGTMPTTTAIQVSGVTKATSSGTSSAISLHPNGRFVFVNANFYGQSDTLRMYFADGVNYLCEFDGTRIVPIRTGISPDAPAYIAYHNNTMAIAVRASLQFSGIGEPYSWTALTGAAEVSVGNDITGIMAQLGSTGTSAMSVFTRDETWTLYGTGTDDYTLVPLAKDAGSSPYTMQNLEGQPYYMGVNGVTQLSSSANFGNFQYSTISRSIQPLIDLKKGLATASCVSRSTNQYRLFFNDGSCLAFYVIPNQGVQVMPFKYSETMYFKTVESVIDANNNERKFASGSDGYVYELDVGTSFDGANIVAYMLLAFNNFGTPRRRKRFRRTVIQLSAKTTADIRVGYEIDYGSPYVTSGRQGSFNNRVAGGGAYWDATTWDTFFWDSPLVSESRVDTPGNGENIGFVIFSDTAENEPYTLHSAIVHYSYGREER